MANPLFQPIRVVEKHQTTYYLPLPARGLEYIRINGASAWFSVEKLTKLQREELRPNTYYSRYASELAKQLIREILDGKAEVVSTGYAVGGKELYITINNRFCHLTTTSIRNICQMVADMFLSHSDFFQNEDGKFLILSQLNDLIQTKDNNAKF